MRVSLIYDDTKGFNPSIAAIVASVTEIAQENLKRAAYSAKGAAKENIASFPAVDTGQYLDSVRVIEPGGEDLGVRASEHEAYVAANTHRKSDGNDYTWYQENGPASFGGERSKPRDITGRHCLRNAGTAIDGMYPYVKFGSVRPVNPGG